MVTVAKRPTGHKIIDQAIAADISEDYVGDAVVNFPYHGLSDGDTVYITSDIDEYNGFWYVTTINVNQFKISEHSEADFVEYYQDAEIDYYQTQEHDWNSIFLPIIYKCTNDRWPSNLLDTARTISSQADDNGFTDLILSGDIKSSGGGINALEFVKISGASDDDLNTVWQIVEVISNSHIVLNIPYSSANSFSGATIQYYYSNYQVKVKIYAGLNNTSPWESKKPYTEVAELSLTPDDNNEVMFSISDYIQSKVQIKNNTLLFSLPLNLDAFTGFYISTSESFDDSDNYTLSTTEQAFVDDSFEGYAIAGKLPFKNLYAGDYADYVYTSGSPALWLTNRTRLLAVEGYYFDVSFIKNIIGDFFVRITKYVSDYGLPEDVQYTDQGIGVYRIPITPDANYDSFCIQAFRGAQSGFVPAVMPDFLTWTNTGTADPPSLVWVVVGSEIQADTNGLGLGNTSSNWYTPYAFEAGRNYSFGYTLQGTVCGAYHIDIVDSIGNILTGLSVVPVDANPVSGTYDLIAPIGAAGIILWFFDSCSCGSGSGACIKHFLSFTNLTSGSGSQDAFAITEEICIDILEVCSVQDGFVTTEGIRLLEDGGYRLLE